MATTPYIAGESPEAIEANRQYQEAMRKLSDSLNNRKKPFIDPVYAAAAKGFLTPKSTGSFFESLGMVGENVAKAEAEQRKLDQDILQQQVGVAGQNIELQRMRGRDADISNYLNRNKKPAAPTGALPEAPPKPGAPPSTSSGALPGAQPPTATPSAPPASPKGALTSIEEPEEDNFGFQVMPPSERLTVDEYIFLNKGSGKSLGQLRQEGEELVRKNFEVKDGVVIDLSKGKGYSLDSTPTKTQIFGSYEGKYFDIPKSVAMELTLLMRKGDEAGYQKLADKYIKGFAKDSKPMSVDERDIAKETAKELAKAKTTREISSIEKLEQKDEDSRDLITFGAQLRKFVESPDAQKITGILSNSKVSSAIATAVEEGIGSKDYRIAFPAIQKLMRNADLNPQEQAKYRVFLMLTVQDQLMRAKYLKGSVSNYEDQLLAAAGATDQDPVEALRIKADMYTIRGQFDRRVAREFEKSGMTAKEFLKSEKYDTMRDKYDLDLSELAFGSTILLPAKKTEQGAAPSTGFVKDPKTGVIRKKREGE